MQSRYHSFMELNNIVGISLPPTPHTFPSLFSSTPSHL
jgi:hypothetical protein